MQMSERKNQTHAFLLILDSNLRYQAIALLLNILETQSEGTRIEIFYVYDNEDDLATFVELISSTVRSFGFNNGKELVKVKSISRIEADDATRSFSIIAGNPITRTSFLRLFFTRWLSIDLEKILYLDIDIFINANVEELFEKKFSTPICAELNVPKDLAFGKHLQEYNAPYFNAGVLLVDVVNWKKMNLEGLFVKIGSQQAFPFLDQDILNIVFKNNWTRLGREYNYLHLFDSNEIDPSYAAFPKIVHFAGAKPWKQSLLTQYVGQYRNNFNRIRHLDVFTSDLKSHG
jgi:lipopolysaccharide biosynthesis glycosyltransferase